MKRCAWPIVLLLLACSPSLLAASVRLADIFTDHMVLQRGMAVPVWGTADAKAQVTVVFAEQTKTVVTDDTGKWFVGLEPMEASDQSRELVVTAGPDSLKCSDVLVGEVWLASGQSNMGLNVASCADAGREMAAADHPTLRFFTVDQHPSLSPVTSLRGRWERCSPRTVAGFSGTAYYFGRSLLNALHVPVGIIHSSVGGTPAEAWTRLEALRTIPEMGDRADKEIAQYQAQPEAIRSFPGARAAWERKYGVTPLPISDAAKNWADPATDTADWENQELPRNWDQLGFKTGGVFWLRKDIDLPPAAQGRTFSLSLNWLNEQYDTVYWNGAEIGHSGDQPPDFYIGQRRYTVPGRVVKAGRNVLALRIVSASAQSGLWQHGRDLEVPAIDPLAIDNHWRVKQESSFPPLSREALSSRPKPNNLAFRLVSGALYNGMIAPIVPYGIRGAIWYQGENNAGRAAEYRALLSTLITDWRKQWGEGDFPFIIQQLVNFDDPPTDANQFSNWSFLREAQAQVARSVPNVGIAIGIDVGDAHTIHPKDKQDVGARLALIALQKTYGQKIESCGPAYDAMKIEGSAVRLTFTHLGGGLMVAEKAGLLPVTPVDGGKLQRFAIAGDDRRFVWADARIDGDTVIVSSPRVASPKAVRYAWANNPAGCNLYNRDGLPAAPFRTDDWPSK